MKVYADKKRTERGFQVEDWMYLKLHPNQQRSLAKRISQKINPKYHGPYQTKKILGEVAHKLTFYLIFYVSLLKQKIVVK